ncbi:MAG: hypothetical protein IJL66_07325, partial [Lachnospiraceae bacterium]|nr:hypothetical protein [Lachnospiraceae bacterium]
MEQSSYSRARRGSSQRYRGRTPLSERLRGALSGRLIGILAAAFFPLMIIYLETVFHILSVGEFTFSGVLATLLYSVFLGLLLFVPHMFIRSPKVRTIVGTVCITVCCILFGVEHFVGKKFKVLYDIKTIL